MTMRFDDKGKFFTDVIHKDAVDAVIQTLTHRVHGQVYLRPGERLRDELNRSEHFLAVTNAVIYDPSGEILYHCRFLTLNLEHIVWLVPRDELQEGGD